MWFIVGTVLPFWQFIPWVMAHGLNVTLFVEHMFANGVAGAFGIDVLVSSVVLWVFVLADGRRAAVPHLWAPLIANIIAAVRPTLCICAREPELVSQTLWNPWNPLEFWNLRIR